MAHLPTSGSGGRGRERQPCHPAPLKLPCVSYPDLNGTSLPVLEGQSLRLVCGADSNPPAVMSWSREGRAPRPSQPSAPGVLELPHVGADDGGEFTCQAQNPLGSQQVSFRLSVQSELQDRCGGWGQRGQVSGLWEGLGPGARTSPP